MRNLLLKILQLAMGLLFLAMAKSAEPGTPLLSPEALEALDWFSGLPVPTVKDLQPVKIFTGSTSQGPTKEIRKVIKLGFLVKDEGETYSVVNLVLGEERWVKNTVRPNDFPWQTHFEPCSLDELAHLFTDHPDTGLSVWGDEPRPKWAAQSFLAGWCCWQQGRNDLAGPLIVKANAMAQDQEVAGGPPRSFRQRIEPQIANHLFELELMRFGEPHQSRATLIERLQKFASFFPDQPQAKQAAQLIVGLRSLIAEEKDHPFPDPRDLSALPPAERARILVGRLRDARIDALHDERDFERELASLGDAAVPALIEALDDHRPTRTVACQHELRYGGPHLESVAGLAANILTGIAHKQFEHIRDTSPYQPTSPQKSAWRQEIDQWWAEYQGKGRRQFLIEAVAKGGGDAVNLSRPLLQDFPAEAGEPIVHGYTQLQHPVDRQNLIYGMDKLHDSRWIELMRKEMREGSTLGIKVAAAWCLRRLGESGTEQPLLDVWEKSLDAPYEGENSDLIEHLAGSRDTNVLEALVKDLRRRPIRIRMSVLRILGGVYDGNPWNGQKETTPEWRTLVEKSLAASLDDDEDYWSLSGVGYHDPCAGDIAAHMLSKVRPRQYAFEIGGTWAERETGRLACLNQWRQSVALPVIEPPRHDPVAAEARNKITQVVFADSRLEGSVTAESLHALQGHDLHTTDLVKILCQFGSNLPKDVVGLRLRAVRTAEPHGIAVKIWSYRGPPPATWQDPQWAMVCDYDGKAERGQGIGGSFLHQNVGQVSQWDPYVTAADGALAKPTDRELILRMGLWFPGFESK